MPESFTEPGAAYAAAKRRGMDLVTLTDHDTIAGALEIAHHPDAVVGVEVTVEFPEDRVPLHVLVSGLDEARWDDMARLRGTLYELLDYADGAVLPCAPAHPLHRVGGELTADHLARCLLLFRLWEGLNGARPRQGNESARIARAAARALARVPAVRLDLHPADLRHPRLAAAGRDLLERLLSQGRRPATHAALRERG
jgi:hypothetical protein